MNMKRRVASLEKRAAPSGACGRCGGGGWQGYEIVGPGGERGPLRGGCPACRRVAGVKAYGSGGGPVDRDPPWLAAV